MSDLKYLYVTVIAASPEKVWRDLTTPEFTQQYWHKTRVQSDWKEGSGITFETPDGGIGCEGSILKADHPRELSYTWRFPRIPEAAAEEPSRVTFLLEALGEHTRLTILHDRFPEGSVVYDLVEPGWPLVIAGLKTLLETGTAVDFTVHR
ncbi:MAG: SRPBCC family protein [Sphingomonadales bacterium]